MHVTHREQVQRRLGAKTKPTQRKTKTGEEVQRKQFETETPGDHFTWHFFLICSQIYDDMYGKWYMFIIKLSYVLYSEIRLYKYRYEPSIAIQWHCLDDDLPLVNQDWL